MTLQSSMHMKRLLLTTLSLVVLSGVLAQKLKKADKAIVENLKGHIGILADDALEGRRAGTEGERKAMDYIAGEFSKLGLQPKGENGGFIQAFPIDEGKQIGKGTFFQVNGQDMKAGTDFFPFPSNPNGTTIEGVASISLAESKSPWFKDLGDVLLNSKDNPHFDLATHIRTEIRNAAGKGASALVFYNLSSIPDNLAFQGKDRSEPTSIPVFYVQPSAMKKFLPDPSTAYDLKMRSEVNQVSRTAHNVVGYVDNHAATTVVLGAHFDHLGYGEDGNSRYTGPERQIPARRIDEVQRMRRHRLPHLQAHRLAGDSGERHGAPRSLRGGRLRPGEGSGPGRARDHRAAGIGGARQGALRQCRLGQRWRDPARVAGAGEPGRRTVLR